MGLMKDYKSSYKNEDYLLYTRTFIVALSQCDKGIHCCLKISVDKKSIRRLKHMCCLFQCTKELNDRLRKRKNKMPNFSHPKENKIRELH